MLTHNEASCHIGLEDSVKGTLGERTAVEGEDLSHIAQAVLIVSGALHCRCHQRVIGRGPVLCSARGVEHLFPKIDGDIEISWIAGVGQRGAWPLSLRTKCQEHYDCDENEPFQ